MALITVDARMIHASGIGTYLVNLLPLIIDTNPDLDFALLGNPKQLGEYNWTCNPRVSLVECDPPIYSIAEQFAVPKALPRNTDLLWVPHFNFPVRYRGKLLVTVHDVFHLAHDFGLRGAHKTFYAKLLFHYLAKRASAIIAVSQFTKDELTRLTKVKPEKVSVIHNGVSESWRNITKTQRPLDKPYILFVGNVKPHKNLKNLLKAFEIIKNDIPHNLVIVGKKEGFITGDEDSLNNFDRNSDRIIFTGHVEQHVLEQYYTHADTLVFPSLYEGFGLPPLEAMACNIPVIASDIPSIREVCGNAAAYFRPNNPMNIATQIIKTIQDDIAKHLLIELGIINVNKYFWDTAARDTSKLINHLL